VDHDEGAARCQRVAGEVEWAPVNSVVRGDRRLVCVGSHHVERKFSPWYQLVPKMDGKRWVCAGEYRDEVPLEGLYCAFCFVRPFVEGGNTLVSDVGCAKV
jgi:hypothetical protein